MHQWILSARSQSELKYYDTSSVYSVLELQPHSESVASNMQICVCISKIRVLYSCCIRGIYFEKIYFLHRTTLRTVVRKFLKIFPYFLPVILVRKICKFDFLSLFSKFYFSGN